MLLNVECQDLIYTDAYLENWTPHSPSAGTSGHGESAARISGQAVKVYNM